DGLSGVSAAGGVVDGVEERRAVLSEMVEHGLFTLRELVDRRRAPQTRPVIRQIDRDAAVGYDRRFGARRHPLPAGSSRLATDRGRTGWRPSASPHARPDPPGRTSPSSSRPAAASVWSSASAVERPSAYRPASSAVVKGPCVRAYRRARSSDASRTGSSS